MLNFESKYIQPVYVVVPTNSTTEWLKSYESLVPDFVVPQSSEELCVESDFSLYKVVVFKHVVDEFKLKAKEKRFVVRKYEPSLTTSAAELGKLNSKYDKLRNGLIRWTTTNFGEAYFLWVHLKSIQCYVESILRYGLPADFEVVLLQPNRDAARAVEKELCANIGILEKIFADEDDEEVHHEEKYFPYVFMEIPVSFV